MQLTAIFDDWLDVDEHELLSHLDELATDLAAERIEPGTLPGPEDMCQHLLRLQEHGWLEIAVDRSVSGSLWYEAVKRVHRHDLPLSVPLLEIWCALRVLDAIDSSAEPAGVLRDRCLTGGAVAVLAIDDLFQPGEPAPGLQTGWVPYGSGVTVIVPVRRGELIGIHALPPGRGSSTPVSSPDPSLPAFSREIDNLDATTFLGSLDHDRWTSLRGEVLVAQSAASTGQAQALLTSTVSYLTVREQFGVPIGTFQALRHRAADLATDIFTAQQVSVHAAEHVASHREPLMLGQLAKSFTGRAAMRMASEAVQLHGGMGFTWEGGVHFGLKRCMYLAMNGTSLGACEEDLGRWAITTPRLLWAGGLEVSEPSEGQQL